MEVLLILGLAGLAGLAGGVWLQSRRIDTMARQISSLETRLRALAAEREPLLLTTPLPLETEEPLLLDTPLPEASNDSEPAAPAAAHNPSPIWIWAIGIALGALYVWFAAAFAADDTRAALAILTCATLAGVAPALVPVWRAAFPLAPSFTLCMSSVLLIWLWPAIAGKPAEHIGGLALVGLAHVALAAFCLRKRWAHAAAFATVAGALVLGVAGFLRARERIAELDVNIFIWALVMAAALGVGAFAARASRHDRGLVAAAGALSAAVLVALAAFSRNAWSTPWAWAPLFAGAALLGAAAWRASRDSAAPASDWAVNWWAGAGSGLALIAIHALAPPALTPLAAAALALGFAFAFARADWRILSAATLIAAGLSLAHALSEDFASTPMPGLGAPWPALVVRAGAAALLYAAWRVFRYGEDDTSFAAEALHAASLAALLIGMFLGISTLTTPSTLLETALRAIILLAAGHIVSPRRQAPAGRIGRWRGPALIAAGLTLALYVGGVTLNPWWGAAPARIAGPLVLNLQALAFALPAGFALAAAGRWFAHAPAFARLCLAGAVALALAWLALELRRAFHGVEMATAPLGLIEAMCYAGLLLGAGLALRTRGARERFAALVRGGYERIAGATGPEPAPQSLMSAPSGRRERRRGRR